MKMFNRPEESPRSPFSIQFAKLSRRFVYTVLCLASTVSSLFSQSTTNIFDPKINAQMPQLLAQRQKEQSAAALKLAAFHDFQFTDRLAESGISFEHHAVDDASKNWKPAHYDHGSGIAVADVDGDGLLDIFFVNQIGGNQLWRNLGHGKFENITARAGVGLNDRICVGASFADIDNDGLPDLFVTTVRGGNVLFKNMGSGQFKDISKEAGVDYVGHSSGAVFFDFNHDGLLDLFVANVGNYTFNQKGKGGFYLARPDAFIGHLFPERFEPSILYQNMGGGKFKAVPRESGFQHSGWSGDASFCDFNQTGFPSLYVLSMQGDDKFYENLQGRRFVEKAAAYFSKTPWGAMGIKFFDYNQDGWFDLLVTDMHSDMTDRQTKAGLNTLRSQFEKDKSDVWCVPEWGRTVLRGRTNQNVFGNAFYHNMGSNTFAEKSGPLGLETYWPWGVSVADVNADGYEDVFVTAGMGYPFRYAINSLLLNDAGQTFYDSEFLLGIEPRAGGRMEKDYFVLDCDGEDKSHPLVGRHHGYLAVRGSVSTRSSAIFDLDDDGDLDIVTNEQNDHPQVLISNLSEKKKIHFLKIKLVGTVSNRDGLGATVKVTVGRKVLTQYHDGKSGYLSQSLIPLYFGLGAALKPDKVEVIWPSGKKQTLAEDLPANTLLTIKENSD